MPKQMICANCGGENVMRDAWAQWDAESQQWTLSATFDHAHCEDCDGAAWIEERELTPTPIT